MDEVAVWVTVTLLGHRIVHPPSRYRAFELVEYDVRSFSRHSGCSIGWLIGFELKRVVLLDADMIVKRNMDELMELPLEHKWIAAAHVCACNPRKLPHYPVDWCEGL